MSTLHTFGCSITQGYALSDTINPVVDEFSVPLSDERVGELEAQGLVNWEDIHLFKPSQYAWPAELGRLLDCETVNYARRGACFHQIARQCAEAHKAIKATDTVIVMWTYLSRISLQWPARTAVPFATVCDRNWGWQTVQLGFNNLFGLSRAATAQKDHDDEKIHTFIETAVRNTYTPPLGAFDRYYNNMLLQQMTDGFLKTTGARIIHLSVEPTTCLDQLNRTRLELRKSLQQYDRISDPSQWYTLAVDHSSSYVILDPQLPLAPNDMHPSEQHHRNFALHICKKYFT